MTVFSYRALFARYPHSLPPRLTAPLASALGRAWEGLGPFAGAMVGMYLILLALFFWPVAGFFVGLFIVEALIHRAPARRRTIERLCDESHELLGYASLAENARETGLQGSRPEFPLKACWVLRGRLDDVRRRSSRGEWVPLRDLYRVADDVRREVGPFL